MPTIGNSTITVTLSPRAADVTLTGAIDAYGPAGTYGAPATPFDAAVFGAAGAHFTIDNIGLVESFGTAASPDDAGIVLGTSGTIINTGTILGGNGLVIGQGGKSVIDNTGTILAVSTIDNTANESDGFLQFGVGIYTSGAASITNTDTIAATHVGIVVENAIGTVFNSGLITVSVGYGVYLRGGGGITNTGTIAGYGQGIFLYNTSSTAADLITNSGLIDAPAKPFTETLSNGVYTFTSTGVFDLGAGTIDNAATGTILASFGIGLDIFAARNDFVNNTLEYFSGKFINAGLIVARYGVDFEGIGGIDNTGEILSQDTGVELLNSVASVYNVGLIDVTGSLFSNGPLTQTAAGTVAAVGGNITNASTGTIAAAEGTGISLKDGGVVKNAGQIIAYRDGIVAGYSFSPATIVNTGTIIAAGTVFINAQGITAISHGVLLKDGGIVTNAVTGTIIGDTGIAALYAAKVDIYNAGHVTATGHAGIYLYPAGTVTNAKTGTIQAARAGVELDGGGFVYNYGVIDSGRAGIYLKSGGAAYNYGMITAATAGIYDSSGAAAIYNYGDGRIFASNGIDLKSGGLVINTGFISASSAGIVIQSGGTVFDSGTIVGGTLGAITFNDAFSASNLLILTPDEHITGIVNGGSGALELDAGGKTVGTAASAQLTNFDSATIETGAIWDMAGTFVTSLGLTLVNNGTIKESASDRITISGALKGKGTVDLSKQVFTLDGAVAAGQKIKFSGTSETLALGDPQSFDAKIEKFAAGDTIDLTSIPRAGITGLRFAKGILTLTEASGSLKLTFANPGTFKNETFALFTDGHGTGITLTGAKAADSLTPVSYRTPQATDTKPEIILAPQAGWLTHEIAAPMSSHTPPITIS